MDDWRMVDGLDAYQILKKKDVETEGLKALSFNLAKITRSIMKEGLVI
jgi:hypothetical protein